MEGRKFRGGGGKFFNLRNVNICDDYHVSDIFRIGGKIFQVGLKLSRWGKHPLGGYRSDIEMHWVQLLIPYNSNFLYQHT